MTPTSAKVVTPRNARRAGAAGVLFSLFAGVAIAGCGPSQAQQESAPTRVDAPAQAHAATRAATVPASAPAFRAPEAAKDLARAVVTAIAHKSAAELALLMAPIANYEHGVSHGEAGFRGPGAPQRLDLNGFMRVIDREAPPADVELQYADGQGSAVYAIIVTCRWKTPDTKGWVDRLTIRISSKPGRGAWRVASLSLWTMSMANK